MDFHQLKIFIEVARQKNFSRAAEKIFLTQPTVSAHIKTLENEIGVLLLDRSQRELQLTSAGQILFQYAQQLLNLEKQALFDIQQESRLIKGHLELVASSIPSIYVLPALLKDFIARHPQVTFTVKHCDTQQTYECIKDFTYDLGFVGEPVPSEGLHQVKLLQDDLILAAPAQTRLPGERPSSTQPSLYEIRLTSRADSAAFLELPFLMREPGSATRLVFEQALRDFYGNEDLQLQVVGYLENQEAIKEAVKIGLGMTVLSYKAVRQELAGGWIKGYRLPDLKLERSLYLIYRSKGILSPLHEAFLDCCLKTFKAD